MKIFSIFDSKLGVFSPPMFVKHKGEMLRSFIDAANDGQTNLCKHPEDFTLFEVGEFDETTCGITLHTAKISLGTALEHKASTGV